MNLAQVGRILSGFALFFSLLQCVFLVVALCEGEVPVGISPVAGFAGGAGIGLLTALLLWMAGRRAQPDFFRKESLAVVGFAWLLAGALGAIPFYWSGTLASGADALFEAVSGLTTTGATVVGGGENLYTIEELPVSIQLWRCGLQWMGGLGIILVFIVLLPAMGVTGKNLLSSEQVGVSDEFRTPRMREQARNLFRLYIFLTVAFGLSLAVLGWTMGGPTPFDALCHALTTMATGGFSTKNQSVGAFDNLPVEILTVLFMFLAGCNFTLLLASARQGSRSAEPLRKSPEFRLYLKVTLILIVAVTLILRVWGGTVPDPATVDRDYSGLGRCLRDASFQVVSILTSTGFATADFQNWPQAAVMLLLLCMFVGGCAGSTAGGLKMIRLLVSLRLMIYTIRRFIRPKSVEKLKVGDEIVPNRTVSAILALLVMWVVSVLIGAFVLLFDQRFDFLSAFSTSLSMMGCTGPAAANVEWTGQTFELATGLDVGPYGGYGDLQQWAKVFCSFQMMLGRLEILAPLVLLWPSVWRK